MIFIAYIKEMKTMQPNLKIVNLFNIYTNAKLSLMNAIMLSFDAPVTKVHNFITQYHV